MKPLKMLARQLCKQVKDARQISAGTIHASNETCSNGIKASVEHYWNWRIPKMLQHSFNNESDDDYDGRLPAGYLRQYGL